MLSRVAGRYQPNRLRFSPAVGYFWQPCKAFSAEKYKHYISHILLWWWLFIIILLLSTTLVMVDCQIPGNDVVYYNELLFLIL